MSAPIRQISLWQAPVFLVNSRLGLFSATGNRSNSKCLHSRRLPLFRSYGYNLPSSLTRVLPRTLGFSPRIPVSVYGTGGTCLARSFSRQCGVGAFGALLLLCVTPWTLWCVDLPAHRPTRLHAHVQQCARLPSCVTPLLITTYAGTGISTCCPSPTLHASG